MKNTLKLVIASLLLVGLSSNFSYAKEKSEGGLLEKIKNTVVEVFTGKEDSSDHANNATGNENALNQIDKNLKKHSGEHKGLENAREAVSKSKHEEKNHYKNKMEEDKGLIDKTADAVEETIEETAETLEEEAEKVLVGEDAKSSHPGKGHGKGHKK